jgi:hypothetical protein
MQQDSVIGMEKSDLKELGCDIFIHGIVLSQFKGHVQPACPSIGLKRVIPEWIITY